jgi:hypothetical protein
MDLETKSLAGDIFVAPLRRSPRWGLLLMVLGILMTPLSFIAIHSEELLAQELAQRAFYEMQRTDLEEEQWRHWVETASKAEMIEEKEKSHTQKRNWVFQFLLLPILSLIFMLGRRLRADDAFKVLERDLRPAILYLRSFSADHIEYNNHKFTSSEENLAKLLGRIGPVIAMGRPGERLPRAGAARLYVHERRWQTVADQLIKRSGLVVLVGGNSPGLLWEMERLRDLVSPRRILIYNPPFGQKHFEKHVQEIFHVALPPKHRAARLICFDENWQPIAKPNLYFTLKAEFTALLPHLLPLPPLSQDAELQHLLTELHKKAIPIPPFRIHPLAIIPYAMLAVTILAQSINEDVNWIIIALRLLELSATLAIGVAASLCLWLYSQKRWLTTSAFCTVISIVLAWHAISSYKNFVE